MDDIKTAWKRLALKHHPDRATPGRRESAEKKMREINEAYQWLMTHAEAEAA
jgi:DnaJ-class molecular chaperone